jgi:hypothetical protein
MAGNEANERMEQVIITTIKRRKAHMKKLLNDVVSMVAFVVAALLIWGSGFALAHDEDELAGDASINFHGPRPPGHGPSQHDMRLVGFDPLQARSAYQPIIHKQGDKWIAYIGHHGGSGPNPLKPGSPVEANGTSIVDVTDPARPKYLYHIEGQTGAGEAGGAQMVRACSGDVLPKGVRGKHYLLRTLGTDGHEIWDVTNPSSPTKVSTIISGLRDTHKSWWECDTGIGYIVSDGRPEGWRVSRMTKVYDLSDPAQPVFIRNFGLVGQQPGSTVQPIPINLHGPISLGPNGPVEDSTGKVIGGIGQNRIYFGYGTNGQGVLQIVDRTKLLSDPTLTPATRIAPTVDQLLYPQVGKLDLFPSAGAHTTFPVLHQPVPDFADNTQGAVRDFVVITNEAIANECQENRQLVYIADVTTEAKPFNVSNYQVLESDKQFCQVGGRFGSHSSSENFTPIYFGRIMFFAWFNAGVRAVDITDPFYPVEVAFYIPATTENTDVRCRNNNDPTTCKVAIQTNNVDVDDRGLIIIVDRANTGMHLLELVGDAKKVVSGQ